jgi:hypothetical protein
VGILDLSQTLQQVSQLGPLPLEEGQADLVIMDYQSGQLLFTIWRGILGTAIVLSIHPTIAKQEPALEQYGFAMLAAELVKIGLPVKVHHQWGE